jgi:hypothetical protein
MIFRPSRLTRFLSEWKIFRNELCIRAYLMSYTLLNLMIFEIIEKKANAPIRLLFAYIS